MVDLEAVLGTAASGVVAFDLHGAAGGRALQTTGRGGPRFAVPECVPRTQPASRPRRPTEGDGGTVTIDFTVTVSAPSP